jgi:hypothetical protein
MPQIFGPEANTVARVSIVAAAIIPLVLAYALSTITRSPANTKVGVPLNQPVPFSHQHHSKELGIDCRYCHAGSEISGFMGMPSTETCMSCHSQIWTNSPLLEPIRESYEQNIPLQWNQVNWVPEFVYFNHAIHIDRGINCNVCHGPVQKMHIMAKGNPFSMAWCLDCHREPEKYLYPTGPNESPRDQVYNLYWKIQAGERLTARERALAEGRNYTPTPEEMAEGQRLVKERGINVQQLSDCWICHR